MKASSSRPTLGTVPEALRYIGSTIVIKTPPTDESKKCPATIATMAMNFLSDKHAPKAKTREADTHHTYLIKKIIDRGSNMDHKKNPKTLIELRREYSPKGNRFTYFFRMIKLFFHYPHELDSWQPWQLVKKLEVVVIFAAIGGLLLQIDESNEARRQYQEEMKKNASQWEESRKQFNIQMEESRAQWSEEREQWAQERQRNLLQWKEQRIISAWGLVAAATDPNEVGNIGAKAALETLVSNNQSLERIRLPGVNLNRANLKGAKLNSAALNGANLLSVNLQDADLRGTDFTGAILMNGNFENANFEFSVLKNTNIISSNIKKADFHCASLVDARLTFAYLDGANLRQANLEKADLSAAGLKGAHLYQANLGSASLIGTDFKKADLEQANLSGANLEGADLRGTNLLKANLSGSNLNFASLTNANLNLANLEGAKNLKCEWLEEAKNWQHAFRDKACGAPIPNSPPENLWKSLEGFSSLPESCGAVLVQLKPW